MSLKAAVKTVLGYLQNRYEILRSPVVSKNRSPEIIGRSRGGRDILSYRIGTGSCPVLFVSAIHGNEVGTIRFAQHLISWVSDQSEMLGQFSFFIVSCLNPDGFDLACQQPDYRHGGREGRLNAQGVDLNRNFDTSSFQSQAFWMHGKDYSLKTPVFAGAQAASEPETQSIVSLIKREQMKLVISFHNAGKDVTGSIDTLGQELAKLYSDKSGYRFFPQEEWVRLDQTGTMKEWCEDNQVTYMEVESSSRWGSDWSRQRPAISAILSLLFHYSSSR